MAIRYPEFYFTNTISKVTIALGDVFNNIRVNKYSDAKRTVIARTVKVPIVFHQDKNFLNWYSNTSVKKPLTPIPLAGLRFKSIKSNPQGRTQVTYARNIFSKATQQWINDIQPTPYIVNFTLSLLCDNLSDMSQLVENILPYFNPHRTLRIKEFDWAPDLERKIHVELLDTNFNFQDEIKNESGAHRYITIDIDFKAEVELYRSLEMKEIIKYAEINLESCNFVDKTQVLVYPSDAIDDKKPFEIVEDSSITGLSILKTSCKTLLKEVDVDGNITYQDISPVDCIRPTNVPDPKQLDLWFDVDSDNEEDKSPYGRDFTLLNIATRDFVPGMEPGNGQEISGGGYEVDSSVQWNRILSWFGTNEGLNDTPFTFRTRVQFTNPDPKDCVFQQLENVEVEGIPAKSVYFDWGLMQGKLYFSFATYGANALNYTFQSKNALTLNNTDIYNFIFGLYDNGKSGIFAYSTNNSSYVVLETVKI